MIDINSPSRPFHYTATAYVQAARALRMRRDAYFSACALGTWNEDVVRAAHIEYEAALLSVRSEEDAAISELHALMQTAPIAGSKPVRFGR